MAVRAGSVCGVPRLHRRPDLSQPVYPLPPRIVHMCEDVDILGKDIPNRRHHAIGTLGLSVAKLT